jgi:hypothetical protein
MTNPSPEKLKAAVQALYRVRAMEGPPGDNGHRSVWHMCAQGAELLSLVDMEGRVQRQELTLLEDHYAWTQGEGLRTGRVEVGGGSKANPASAIVHTDPQLVPGRLMRAAMALENYEGEDRYILHIKRVLALAKEGLELQESSIVTDLGSRPTEPLSPAAPAQKIEPATGATSIAPTAYKPDGLVVVLMVAVGLLAAVLLLFWLF